MTFDPLVEERVSPTTAVERAGNGDPKIVPRGETEAVPYTRASGLANFLVRDIHHLKQWEERYLAQALGRNPDLASWAASLHYSTGPISGTQPITERKRAAAQLDEIIEMALERERINEAANCGSVVHEATVPDAPEVPMHPLMAGAVSEYHKLTAGLERVASEVFVVCDELKAGGTFDSGYLSPEFPGFVVVGDTKTGKGFHQAEFEIQLATYARGEIYLGPDQRLTFEEYFGVPANLEVGYLVHVPLEGKPRPRIVKLNLARGWYYAKAAARIRDDRATFDKVGVGEKVDHLGLANFEMGRLFAELVTQHDNRTVFDGPAHELADADQRFHADAQALYRRFSHIWPDEFTDTIKRRLS